MAYLLEFFAFQNFISFFLALKSTTATIGYLDIVSQVSAWDQNLAHVYRTSLSDLHHFRYPSFTRSP